MKERDAEMRVVILTARCEKGDWEIELDYDSTVSPFEAFGMLTAAVDIAETHIRDDE